MNLGQNYVRDHGGWGKRESSASMFKYRRQITGRV